jgi:hypothetical protein
LNEQWFGFYKKCNAACWGIFLGENKAKEGKKNRSLKTAIGIASRLAGSKNRVALP